VADAQPQQVQRVLVVAAHPDDVDFGFGGTIATWTDAGLEVSYCIVTDGDAGGFDPKVPRSAIGGIRQEEQRKAAAALGVTDVEFLGYPDGRLVVSFELRRDITRVIRRTRPDRMVIPAPQRDLRSLGPSPRAIGFSSGCGEVRRDLLDRRQLLLRRPSGLVGARGLDLARKDRHS